MKIGALGDLVFETSMSTVRTFKEFQRSNAARWAAHEVIGLEPQPEFVGPGQKSITLPIALSVVLLGGKTIEDQLAEIEVMVDTGAISILAIGDRVIGKYYIESMSDTTNHFGGKGEFLFTELTLSLKHYPEREPRQ